MSPITGRDPLAGRIPIILITGFLGSGKTTLLGKLLRHPGMDRAAVIINELGDIAIDHQLVAASSEQMTLLGNGCLCCTVRTDLQETLREMFIKRGGRFGAHNLHENQPGPTSFRSDTLIVGTFFNAGVRAYDTANPFQPQEIAYYVPEAPKLARSGAIQLNDVYVDEKRIVYTVDRHAGGLYILEMTV